MKSVSQPIGHLGIEGPMSLCAGTPGREDTARLSTPALRLSTLPGDQWDF
jgi:hypothetical protein